MQRSSRNLLFGGRSDAAAAGSGVSVGGNAPSTADLEAMEADNQAGVDGLRAPAAMMKDVRVRLGVMGDGAAD